MNASVLLNKNSKVQFIAVVVKVCVNTNVDTIAAARGRQYSVIYIESTINKKINEGNEVILILTI